MAEQKSDEDRSWIENKTFNEIRVGDTTSLSKTLTRDDISLFAALSGDLNPTHLDPEFAAQKGFNGEVAHSMWAGALVSSLLGNELPGPGTVYRGQELNFRRPVFVGDTVRITLDVREKMPGESTVLLNCKGVNQDGNEVFEGVARVVAPIEKIKVKRPEAPGVQLTRHDAYRELMEHAGSLESISTAVAHPCDESSLKSPIEAAEAGLIEPILVGPEQKIRAVAEEFDIDLNGYRIEDAPHSHAAAARAVEIVRAGEAETLMKGSLHTDELLGAVVSRDKGLRTARRLSHCFIMDVPTYHKPLVITDAAINIYPGLEEKVDIVKNAVALAQAFGVKRPKVAILSAVETVNPKIPSTLEAAALCKMADRGQISGALLDGPLAFDNAISAEAAKTKHIASEVSGDADIFLVPDLEAGNMLAKQLSFLANAESAGIVLGARVPIILTSRADSVRARMASCATAVIYAHSLRATATVV